MLLQLGPGHCRADAPAPLLFSDRAGFRDALDVHDKPGLHDVGAHLDQQVRAAGQHACLAVRGSEQGYRPFQ